ncbi:MULTISPECIES: hypothetical protein [Paenibacillus]|uniref:hypothetical protein n=1 Tax=Paenibacillus TaxID=44249 RepID=UPI00117D471F|nr:hypothetical protein [Paenibacillus rhizosphaerae]
MKKPLVITCLAITLALSFGFYQSSTLKADKQHVKLGPSQVLSRNTVENSQNFGQPLPGTIHISDVPKGGIFCPQISH